jgi:carbamoylphosphate synthase small subunit
MANGSCRTNFFARKNYEKKQTNSKLKYAPHIIQDELFSQANFSNNLVRVSCDNFHYWFGKCESEPNALAIILILDFGSQYTQVIARRIRECHVYSTIARFDTPAAEIAALKPKGLILSGGPSSVYSPKAPLPDPAIFQAGRAHPRHLLTACS